jgi:hypothetical protein
MEEGDMSAVTALRVARAAGARTRGAARAGPVPFLDAKITAILRAARSIRNRHHDRHQKLLPSDFINLGAPNC